MTRLNRIVYNQDSIVLYTVSLEEMNGTESLFRDFIWRDLICRTDWLRAIAYTYSAPYYV